MPDSLNPSRQPEERLRQFDRFMADGGTIGKPDNKKVKFSADRGYASIDVSEIDDPTSTTEESPRQKKKPRTKESSKHFGVRFRPDLQKWVAEIRVFEWKSVDKKVWLGTFDSEVGAACAVDAARKLLKCQKKRPPNFPCAALSAYNESIPSHLQLTNIAEEGMFKEVTVFVKRKAQEYAAGFCTSKGTTAAVGLREQLVAPQYQIEVGGGNGCFHLPSESRQLFAVPEDDVFPTGSSYGTNESFGSYGTNESFGSYGTNESFGSYGTNESFGSYGTNESFGVPSDPWGSPATPTCASMTYSSGPSSCSSEGTSPEDRSWVQVQPSMWMEEALCQGEAQVGDYCLVAPSSGGWEDPMPMMDVPMGMDDQTTIEVDDMEYLFNMEDMDSEDRDCRVAGDQAIDPTIMNIFFGDEAQAGMQIMQVDNEYGNWTFQQSFNSLSYSSLSNSFENREVC